MATFKPLEQMEKKYSIDSEDFICSGDNGKIFRLDEDRVVKIPYNPFNKMLCNGRQSQFNLFQEYKKQEFAVELGIKYPTPEGIFAIKYNETGQYYPGIVMIHKAGSTLDKLCGEELREAIRQRDKELEKARDLGVIVRDNHNNNALWDKKEICLLDAAGIEFATSFN